MVSFQAHPLSLNNTRKTATPDEFDISSKKRKWDDKALPADHDHQTLDRKTKSIFDIELHLETPLPLEWERCLDIQSGQIHFYNTRTNKRTSGDPRTSPDPSPIEGPGHMSLDLELNLPCDSQRKNNHNLTTPYHLTDLSIDINHQPKKIKSGNIARIPSWLAFEGGDDDQQQQQQEMVATACMKCHMLVMLCKSSPTCPNCKFTHPPDQTPPKLFKQRLSLLC